MARPARSVRPGSMSPAGGRWLLGAALLAGCAGHQPATDPPPARTAGPAPAPAPAAFAVPFRAALPGFDSAELEALDRALAMGGLTRADLGFKKDVAPAEGVQAVVREALGDPLGVAAAVDRCAEALPAGELGGVARLGQALEPPEQVPARSWATPGAGVAADLKALGVRDDDPQLAAAARWPEPLRAMVHALVRALAPPAGEGRGSVPEHLQAGLGVLSPAQRALVHAWGLRHVVAPDEAFPDFVPTALSGEEAELAAAAAADAPEREVLRALAAVDLAAMGAAAERLLDCASELGVIAAVDHHWATGQGGADPAGHVTGTVLLRITTHWGDLVVGGPGPNVYDDRAIAFIVDLGGDDAYRGRAGAVDGDPARPLALIVDAGGNDTYASAASPGCGGALLGAVVVLDLAGDDRWQGRVVAEGAAIAGAAVVVDEGGDDTYVAERHAQGAALGGLGVLRDSSGQDTYRVACFGQGFARTNGVGLLADTSGNDIYEGGGAYPYLPQAPEHTYAHCQGYAIGVREYGYAGGVGLLIDRAGDDVYRASMHAQGAACFYALGALIDLGGNDRYEAVFNAQGAAVHEAAGFLIDRAGDDTYTLHSDYARDGLGQGGAHDFAVGVLHDAGGSDTYRARAAAQGVGLTTGLGILVDRAGDDRYQGATGHLQGAGRRNRQMPSLGVLVDGGGRDAYSTDRHDGTTWVTSDLGVGIDVGPALDPEPEPRVPAGPDSGDAVIPPRPRPAKPAEAALTAAEFDRLFAQAAAWDVGEARQAVRDARDELISWGARVLGPLAAKLGEWNGLVLWAVDDILTGVARTDREAVTGFLEAAMAGPDWGHRITGMMVAARLGVPAASATARELLGYQGVRRWGAIAAGLMRSDAAVEALAEMLGAEDETEAAIAVQALGRIGVMHTWPHLRAALAHRSFLVRDAAIRAFAGADDDVLGALLDAASDATASSIECAALLRAAGWCRRSAVAERAAAMGPFLEDLRPAVRAAAVEGLGSAGGAPEAVQLLEQRLAAEPDAGVRRAIREALQRGAETRPRRQDVHLHSGVVEYPDYFGGG